MVLLCKDVKAGAVLFRLILPEKTILMSVVFNTFFNMRHIIYYVISIILDLMLRMEKIHLENSKIFKAFCDETRLMVLSLLQNGEKCACVLLEKVSVSQSTLSHHMKILVDSGVVTARNEGKWTYYSISATGSEHATTLLRKITTVTVDETETENERCCR